MIDNIISWTARNVKRQLAFFADVRRQMGKATAPRRTEKQLRGFAGRWARPPPLTGGG